MILIPKHRELILPDVKAKVRGRYIIETECAITGVRRKRGEFPNLITNLGLDLLVTNTFLAYCSVGSGNTTPAFTNTTLVTFIASTNTTNGTTRGAQGSSPYFGTTSIVFNFSVGTATGNLAEIGIGNASNGTGLFSRALVLDSGGSPTTITVLSSEALYVTYVFEVIVPTADVTGTVTIAGTSYSYTLRASSANTTIWARVPGDPLTSSAMLAYTGAIAAVTGTPAGTQFGADSTNTPAYSTGSFALTSTGTWGLTSAVATIQSFETRWGSTPSGGSFQWGISPSLVKDNAHILTVTSGMSWTRM